MAASLLLLHNLLFKPLHASSSSSLFLKPISLTTIFHSHKPFLTVFNPPSQQLPLRFFCSSSPSTSSLSYPETPSSSSSSLPLQEPIDPNFLTEVDGIERNVQHPEETEEEEEEYREPEAPIKASSSVIRPAVKLPTLSVKERKELASYAHSLGKKLKVQQVGKSGVTDSVAASFVENLESNELLKLKIHNNCPGELPDVIKQLEEATGSVVVGQIGRSVILYRPSLTKMMAEEKKKQAQRVPFRKGFRVKPTEPKMQKSGQEFRPTGRGRRGKSRFEVS